MSEVHLSFKHFRNLFVLYPRVSSHDANTGESPKPAIKNTAWRENICTRSSELLRRVKTTGASFLPEEREWFQRLTDWGIDDSYRIKYPDKDDKFIWFDYRSKGFDREPKRGLRIDHLLSTQAMTAKLVDSDIEYTVLAMEKPSDHCPLWSSFDI